MPGVMTSRTRVLRGSLPSATARTVMSRSVTMPARRSLSQMGSGPTSRSFILRAASCSVASGLTHSTPRVMTSFTCMAELVMERWGSTGLIAYRPPAGLPAGGDGEEGRAGRGAGGSLLQRPGEVVQLALGLVLAVAVALLE